MKTKIGILLLTLFCQLSYAQIGKSRLIKGQVRNDLVPVENVIVFNTKDHTGTNVNTYGSFEMMASVNDTLVFSSLVFKSKRIILKEEDFLKPKIFVPLEVFTNELAEIIIKARKDMSPVSGNTQKYVDLQYFGDEKSSPKNTAMPPDGSIDKGMDFVRMYKDVLKIMRKNSPEKTDFHQQTSFSDYVINHVNYSFLSNTLKLKDDQIKLFLVFCENDSKSRSLMNPSSEFQLLDFLSTKNKEFKKIIAN
ncbi:hypothetical protein SLW70_00905 [Flavobacterium sp. NG2]|uniref:hypothetical protein n=1 Tax=Flavobacterium sp. NG2 TaxID=3097547 RepID=UPI002A80636C|nr:hypothetical protein [Flavobacterium sp. NG2]WPR71719.1 hypothetical protein SLW70_00905 [Flavobacterium sp. NG2]